MKPVANPWLFACLTACITMVDSEARVQGSDDLAQAIVNSDAVDYVRDVRPVLRARCATCHNEADAAGGLRLDLATALMKGGDSGPAIVPGHSAESRLIHAVLQTQDLRMPPPEEAQPLEKHQIDILRRWIDQGAMIPEDESKVSHWAFQKPVRGEVPAFVPNETPATGSGDNNPIDAFLAVQHRDQQLTPFQAAPKHVQLRRIYLDLTGLPPTPEQLTAFLNDDSPNAWEKVVDELLASPHYGERWGRHWMDVWRYSDWDGYGAEVRESKPHIWRWRDWIIESLNDDKAYDQMIVEMLAADEADPENRQALRATGYLVRNWYVFNRNTWIDNTIEHTGKAFLGITFNCARCHDHMYDPVSQSEYYQLRAFFEPHDVRTDRLPGQSDLSKDGLVRVFDSNTAAQTLLFIRGDEKNPLKEKPLSPHVPAAFGPGDLPVQPVELPATAYYPGLQSFIAAEALSSAESELQTAATAHSTGRQNVELAQAQLLAFQQASGAGQPTKTPMLMDDFTMSRPDVWTTGTGMWQYQDGRVLQLDPADTMCSMKTVKPHPADFVARLKFRTTGGDVFKSVGISFDATDDENYSFVYASAGGSKLQVAHRVNGGDQYPPAGAKELAIEVNQDHELQVAVHGTQVDVSLNGQAQLTYNLPGPRPAEGRFHIWTYDATAEFRMLEISDRVELSESSLLAAVQRAESAAILAEKKSTIASATLEFAKTRIAADQANYAKSPAADAKELSLAAGKAERALSVLQEQLKLLTAEQSLAAARAALPAQGVTAEEKLTKAVTDAEAAVAAAKTAIETAEKLTAEPFEAYTRFTPVYPTFSSGRRLALARWIVSRDNPLTARVAINHIWLRHFHQPLVPTVFDFGMNGKPATHPELLDWLACELMDNGWKMKPVHRMIVTSNAYRRASVSPISDPDAGSASALRDPENRYLWRQNSYRMEAEVVRDATLSVAGQLDSTMSGPDLDPAAGLTLPRRSIYFRTSKEKKMTFLSTFDSANPVECYQRAESISPQQSLAMSNSPLTLAQSRITAANLSLETAASPLENAHAQFVSLAFQRILARHPTEAETIECSRFLSDQAEQFVLQKSLTAFAGGAESLVKPSPDATQRARENLVHVLFNHNDFVTVR